MALLFGGIRERLDRIDATLERIDATIDRNAQAFERSERAFARIDATIDRNTQAFERGERAFEDFQEVFRQDRLRSERIFAEQLSAISDIRADIRAHTQAVQGLLDRWGQGPSPAS